MEILDKQHKTIANILEIAWITRYPRPEVVTLDHSSEFMAAFQVMIEKRLQNQM